MIMPQPTGSTLSPEVLARFERELHDTRRSHEARLRETPELDDISIAIRRRSEEALGEIVAALTRLEDGTFGECETCLAPINPDRLDAIPHTRHCMNCARQTDQARAQR